MSLSSPDQEVRPTKLSGIGLATCSRLAIGLSKNQTRVQH
jgi:hypothetical protein